MPSTIILNMETPSVQYLCKKDKRLAKAVSMVGPISYEPHDEDPYCFLVHEIIEQMLSVKVGEKIFQRLVELCNNNLCPITVANLTDEQIRSIGTSKSKVAYIRSITDAFLSGRLDYARLKNMPDAEVMKELMSIRGIGAWTAKMYLIFVLDRQDILPLEDVAFLQAYQWLYKTDNRNKSEVVKKCKKWSPYSSIAVRYLYRALDTGITKNEFHMYK